MRMGLIPSLVILFAVAGLFLYVGMIYNGIVAMRNDIDKSWANIDVLLKQRHDEVPRLVDVCKGYMQYERETLQTLIEARTRYASAATLDQKVQASGSVSASMGKVFAVAENYPALQANASFLQIQKRITELESQIADRREFYNDSINVFNTRIQQMPDALVARFFEVRPRAMFLVSAADKSTVRMGMGTPQETLKP
jgi:LemA protein